MRFRRVFWMVLVLLLMPVGFEPVVSLLGRVWG
jgi:hypothetical protein